MSRTIKAVIGVIILVMVITFMVRIFDLWSCKSTGWFDLKRETHFSFVTGNCVVHSGRINAETGEPVWVILKNDRGLGDDSDDSN